MRTIKIISLLVFGYSLMGLNNSVYAYDCENWVAKLQSLQGSVQVRQPSNKTNKQWINVQRDATFCKGDVLRVQENSRAALLLKNETLLRLNQNTTITFTSLTPDQPSVVSIEQGIGHFISRVKATFEVITPFINAAIEGTEFVVTINKSYAEVTVFEGNVRAYNQYGEVRLNANQTAQAKKGQAPVIILKAKPRDAVNWSLYYPMIIKPNTESLVHKASLKLSVGQIDQAKKYLQQAITQNPDNSAALNSSALAMQAIINIVQNNKEQGLALAQQAVAADNKNATAKLALSYALQAHFKINDALATLQDATKDTANSSNALLWSRLAELYLMHGELDKALSAAKKANKFNPNLGRSHTVLGFAYLTRIEIQQAITSFNTAIEKDQTDPLARLGLGLATIRQGDLSNGRREIEYATTLDPNNALIRSYLGKAYYEEKRNKLAAVQFEMAKTLDPNDPTAYFYNAIRKQSENMPGEALLEIQKATELNQQRAVYRSKLLLDQDQAVRNSSTAQIYSELGFEETALLEAAAALQKDFTNHSAHRFLSVAYAKKDRNEIARVSEAYQSIMYSPLNTNPIPPHIGETDLGTVNNAGPTDAGLNEYDALFARNGTNWRVTALGGNHQTAGDEIIYSAVEDNFALSLGQYHYQTGGFRPNNDLKQDIINMFFQWAINPRQSIQLEYSDNRKENGDLRLKFDPTDFTDNRRETDDKKSIRLGYLFKPTPNLDFVASFNLQENNKIRESISSVTDTIDLVDGFDDHHNSHNTELQLVYKTPRSQTILGTGNYVDQFDNETILQLKIGSTVISDSSSTSRIDKKQQNTYLYSQLNFNNLALLYGLSNEDHNDTRGYNLNQINPKFGIKYKINSMNIKLVYFRTLKRSLINSQTLEPTNIFGFNQYYDDITSTDAKNIAIGLQSKITHKSSIGLEFIKRELQVPILSNNLLIQEGQKEHIDRVFFNWLPINEIALNFSIEYSDQLREYDSSAVVLTDPLQITTTKYPMSITYNSNKKMSYQLISTYYDHDIIQPISATKNNELHDSFMIVDTIISYDLAKRAGRLSLIINNLFDQDFKYQDTTFRSTLAQQPLIQHDRSITLRATFNF